MTRSRALAAVGCALVLAGIVAYFVVALRFGAWLPGLRNHALPSWLAVAVGLALGYRALLRAPRGRRLVPGVLLGVGGVLAVAFAALLYVASAVPDGRGPAVGAAAPDFALADATGRIVRLADFRGRPLLLVFYRGHW